MVAMRDFLHEKARSIESFVWLWAALDRSGFQTAGSMRHLVASDDLEELGNESLLLLF